MDHIKKIEQKKVKFGKNHSIRITTYYMSEFDSGLKIEVKRFSLSKIVEIYLKIGDDKIIQKRELTKIVLKNPTKKKIDQEIAFLIEIAKKMNYVKGENREQGK